MQFFVTWKLLRGLLELLLAHLRPICSQKGSPKWSQKLSKKCSKIGSKNDFKNTNFGVILSSTFEVRRGPFFQDFLGWLQMAHLSPILTHLGPSWPLLAPFWLHFGSILAPSWPILAPSCFSPGHLGRHLGPSSPGGRGSQGISINSGRPGRTAR